MSIHDEEAPPVVMPPVRRDPRLGWDGDGMRPIGTEPEFPVSTRIRGSLVRLAIIVAIGAALIVAGAVAHGILRAIMLGWSIV